MRAALILCTWLISVAFTGWFTFKLSHQLAHPPVVALASFQGQAVLRSDVEDYYPAYRARAAGELVLTQVAAKACGWKKASQARSDFYLAGCLPDWPES
ncbi:MAG: hypothetical protein U0931_38700 [Vulcanimicrobiota bacterium]